MSHAFIKPKLTVLGKNHPEVGCDNRDAISSICNWTNPVLVVGKTSRRDLGVFTSSDLRQGDLLIVFGGRVLTSAQTRHIPEDLDMLIQIEEDLFFIPLDLGILGIGERVNHSCEPNAGFSGQMSVVAMRDIVAGEEVSIDYASCDARPSAGFECQCGSQVCRKLVTGNDWLLPNIQMKIGDYFQPFLKQRLAKLQILKKFVGNG